MAILGQCESLLRSVTNNELTTVAAAYTVNQFIGPSGCANCGSSGPPDAVNNISGPAPGLPSAMGNAALLADSITGLDAPTLPNSAECPSSGTVPANCLSVKKLNTAANALAACVNSSGPTSSQCAQLFDCMTPGAVYSTTTSCTLPSGATPPADTLQAILSTARNPAKVSMEGIYETAAHDAVFSPTNTGIGTDYTLSLNITGAGMSGPNSLAIDAYGDVWLANFSAGTVSEIGPNGAPLTELGDAGIGYPVGTGPSSIAFDLSGNAWVVNEQGNNIDVLNPQGQFVLGSPLSTGTSSSPTTVAIAPTNGSAWVSIDGGSGVVKQWDAVGAETSSSGFPVGNTPSGVAVDAAGYVWVANEGANSVTQLSPAGALVSTNTTDFSGPETVAVDPSGNIWVTNQSGTAVTELLVADEKVISTNTFKGGGIGATVGAAIDAAGNVWVTTIANTNIVVAELNSSGVALSPTAGFIGAGLASIGPLAIDQSGNVWVADGGSNSVTVFFGAAAPTITPLANAIAQGFAP